MSISNLSPKMLPFLECKTMPYFCSLKEATWLFLGYHSFHYILNIETLENGTKYTALLQLLTFT